MIPDTLAKDATTNMVQGQLAPNGIRNENVLNAFMALDRGSYVAPHLRAAAYCDETVLGAEGHVELLRPLTLAIMVQHLADWRDTGKIAVIGDNNGYVKDILMYLHFSPVNIADEESLNAGAPYDAVLVNGAIAAQPTFLRQFVTKEGSVLAVMQPKGEAMGNVSAIYADEILEMGQTACPYFEAFRPAETFAL